MSEKSKAPEVTGTAEVFAVDEGATAQVARVQTAADDELSLVARMATDPNVDVDKLERLIAMHERALDRRAKEAYAAAYVAMQGELPHIDKRGHVRYNSSKAGTVDYRHTKLEDIQSAVRPVLRKHGFALRFEQDFSERGQVKVKAILSHEAGHSESTTFVGPSDPSGSKNDIQALGSGQKYAMRYATVAILAIEERGADDDGRGGKQEPEGEKPEGYDGWLADMDSLADAGGTEALMAAWNQSTKENRLWLTKNSPDTWGDIKAKAARLA
jgi:hypothetical protein